MYSPIEIKSSELILKGIENIPKEIYDPYPYLFVNKFQTKKLTKELEKIIKKTCDFDEDIQKYKINKFYKEEEYTFFTKITNCWKKLKILPKTQTMKLVGYG